MLLSELASFIDANRYKGRRAAFGITDTKNYLRWAFLHDYLFVAYDESRISGIGVAYPIDTPYTGDESVLTAFKRIPVEQEAEKELCVMDWCALDTAGRVGLVYRFKTRFPNWENQRKWGIQFDKVSELSNKYINLIHTL
jgi:hypothetical protein